MKVFVHLSLFMVLVLSAVFVSITPAHAAPDTPAPNRTPITCKNQSGT